MAQNNGTSLEDVNKTAQSSGVFNSVLSTAEDVGEGVLNFGKSILGTGADMIGDTAQAAVNLGKNIVTGDIMKSFDLGTVGKPKQQFNEFEEKQAEKLNSISGMTMASDILGTIKDFTYKPVKEYLLGNELTNNLKVDKKDFEANVGYLKSSLDEVNKKYENLNKDKYKTFLSFNDRVYQQYLKEKGTTNILDQEDFELYKQQELKRLNGIEQAAIAREQSQYMLDTASIEEEKLRKEEELKKYLNENISTDGTKTGEQFYNEFLEKESENIKQREYINTIGEIYNYSKEQVEAGLEAKGLSKNSDFAGYDALKESIIDDITAENQYMMSIKGMKDLPEYEKLASQAKEVRDVSLEFKLDFAKKFLDIRNNPENKGLTNVELKNKALKAAWDEMPLDKKQIFKTKEELVTKVATLKNLQEAKDRAKNFDPRALLDIVSAGVSTIQGVIDQAYDFDTEDVPHFVKQDTRNLVYSGEGIGKAIATSITYNPDALVDLVIGTKGVTKIANGARAVADALNTSDKIMKITSKIGYGQGTYNLLSKSVKNLTSSQVYGTVGDTVLDNVMEEAPTKGIETFNFISNLLFDSTPFVYREAKDGLTQSTSMNRISYEFLNGDQKKAVQQFADTMSAKTGTKMGLGEAKVILDNGVKGLYHTLYNPNEYKDILTKQGGLYEFVGNQINGLSKDKLDKVLTEKGISLQYTDTVQGLDSVQIRDINDAFNKYNSSTGVEKQFQEIRLNKIIDEYKERITPGLGGDGIVIDKKKIDKDFITLKDNAIEALEKIKLSTDKKQLSELLETYNYNLTEARRKYSNKEFKKMVHLIDPAGNNIQISFKEFSELQDKNLLDLKRDGKVKITKNGVDTEYTFKTQKQLNLEESYNNFLDTKKDEIDSFEKQYGVTGGGLRQQLNNLLFGRGVSKASWAEGDTAKLTAFAELSTKIINDFLGNKYVADKPVHINKVIPNKDEYALRSGDDIREYMTKHDSYVNISYGEFKDMSSGKITNAIYLMPGKRLLDNNIIGRYFNGLNNDGKIIFGVLKEQGNKIIKDIIELGMDGNKFDFERGKIKTISVLSAGDIDGIFDEAGLIKKSTIDKIISETLGKQANEDISKFIYEAVKDLDQSQSLTIKPIIYNLSYNYLNNKELIDQVIKSQDINFQSIFADILLSPQIRDKIVKNIYGSRSIPDKYKEVHEGLLSKFESEWELYKERLIQRKLLLQEEKNELNDLLSNNKLTDVQAVNIEKEIETINNRILAVEKELRSKGTFIKGISNQELLRLNTEFLKNKSLQASGTMLGASFKILGDNIKPIESISDHITSYKEILKDKSLINKKEIKELLSILEAGDLKKSINYIESIDDKFIKSKLAKLKHISDNMSKLENSFIKNEDLRDEYFKEGLSGKLNHEYALENNPIKKQLLSFINNSSSGQDDLFNDLFIKEFNGGNAKTLDDLLESGNEDFIQFIKGLELPEGISDKDIIESNKDIYSSFKERLESILKKVGPIETNKSSDISKELIDEILNDRKVFNAFKRLNNQVKYVTGENSINFKITKNSKGKDVLSKVESKYSEQVIQFDNMKNNGMNFKVLNGFDATTVKKLKYGYDEFQTTLSSKVNKYFNNLKAIADTNNDEVGYLQAISKSPIFELKLFSQLFNNQEDQLSKDLLKYTKVKKDQLFEQNNLLEAYEEGYTFIGGLGDKNSQMHIYRMPKDFIAKKLGNKFNKSNLQKIKEDNLVLYHIEYAYANGYVMKDRIYKTADEFKKELLSRLNEGYSTQELKDELMKMIYDGDKGVNILDIDVIRKREASNASNYSTFGNYKENLDLYIIDENIEKTVLNDFKYGDIKFSDFLNKDGLLKLNSKTQEEISLLNKDDLKIYLKNRMSFEQEKIFKQYIEEFSNTGSDIANEIKDILKNENNNFEKVHTYISNTYLNDLQDGTSFISERLLNIRGKINWIKKSDDYKQFKDHFFGEVDGVRVLGKTLFNAAEITSEAGGSGIPNAVAIGKSSLKLGKDLQGEKLKVFVNGKEYSATKISGTDTSFFRNAATDSFGTGEDLTFSDSIKASLSREANDKLTEIQKRRIKEAFEKFLGQLGDFNVNVNSYSSIDKMVNDMVSLFGDGYSTSGPIQTKINQFLTTCDEIINKPQDKGQSMFIRESSTRIKPTEVIMNRNSHLVKQIFSEVKEKMFPGISKLSKEQEDEVYNNLYAIGYRYPVPSKYNIGVYKIRFSDEFDGLSLMGTEQVIPHPQTTYMKLEGDNDGDHIFFISTNSEFGNVIMNDVLGTNIKDKAWETLSKSKGYKNDFIIIDQVEKITGAGGRKEYKDILSSRLSAVEAKTYIGNVSATIRTLKLLSLMKNDSYYKDGEILKSILKDEESSKYEYEKMGLSELDKLSIDDIRSFSANSAQLLQTTLDFGNSGLDQFDPQWFMKLLNIALPGEGISNIDKYKFQSEVISTLSMGYSRNELDAVTIGNIFRNLNKKDLDKFELSQLNQNYYGVIGDKRKLLDYIYRGSYENENGKLINLGSLIQKINTSQDLNYLVNVLLKDSKDEVIKKYIKLIKEDKLFNNSGILSKKFKENLFNQIKEELKSDENLKDLYKYLDIKDKKEKELYGKEFFDKVRKLDKDDKYKLALVGYLGGEYKLVNYSSGNEMFDFFQYSDDKFIERLDKELKDQVIKLPKIISKKESERILNERLENINGMIDELKGLLEGGDMFIKNQYNTLLKSKGNIESKIDELNLLKDTKEKYIETLSTAKIEPIRQEYVFPGTSETLIDIDPRGVDVLVGESEGMVNQTRRGLVFRVSQFFKDYTPKFLFDYNNINDKLGIRNENILEAYKTHHLQFNEYYRNKEGVISMLKNAGLEKYDEMGKKMQYELLDYKNGRFILKDDFIPSIKRHLEGTLATSLIDNQTFIKALTDYQKGTITHVVKVLNDLEDMGFKVHANYIKEPYSLVTDVLEAHKADPQLALRLNGFFNEEQFKIFVRESAVSKGIDLKQGTLQTMIDVLYKSQGKWYDKVLGFLKMTHYSMNYGTMSLVTGNGIMSGLAQMLPNYIELRSYMRKNITDIKNGFTIMQRFGLLDSESVIMFGTGIGKDFNDSGYLDAALDKAFKSVTDKNIKGSKSAAFIHSVLTNPLGGSDYPIENLRKLVAISNTMKRFGLETPNDLERKIALHGSEFEGLFRHHVREAFSESGGGVNSSSAIYRDTIFSHLHNYADIWGVRFFTQTVGYLMGWSFRKTATLIEKESALGYGLRDLVKGNYKSAKAHLDDWFTYNSMIAHQMAMAMGIFMKMEKYEKDTNDRVSFDDFAKTFMNSVVSFQILVEKHLNAWESADEAGGTTQDKIGYTTVGMIRHMFRLFGQTNFIATMYKHYTYSQLEGKANLFDSLQFAMNEHYSSFIRFNGIDQLENIYNTLGQEGRSAMLGTGAKTEEEKLLQDLQNGNYFGIYKEKGFIKGMYDMFDSLLLKNSKSVPAGLQSIISKDLVELVMQDKELSKLIRGGEFGQEEGNYNIEKLFGKIGTNMNEEQAEGVNDIYKQLKDYTYDYLKANGKKADSFTQSTIDRMLQDEIDKALKKEGINIEDLIAASPYSPDTTKTLAVLETKYGLKNPLVISTLIEREYSKQLKELKDSKGKFTGEVSEYGKAYKDLTEEDKLNLKRDLLVKYQKYFNLNRQLGMDIIAQDIKMNHSDKLDKLKETVDSYGSSGEDMMNFIQKSYLIGQVAKEGDTSVSKLHSKYALAAKGLAANETTVAITNKFLHKLFEQEGLSHKEKLANAAGFLSGLNKATYGMLSNNEEFNKLTEDSRKLLANWVFKINSDAMKYDSNDLLNDLSNNSYGGNGSGSAYRKMYPKYKSNSFEGQRPNFSKQFAPISKMIPNTIQYVSKDPDGYLRGTSPYIDTQGVYNNMKSPFMKQYSKLLIEQLFYGYKSKGIIRPVYNEAKVDNEYKKSINIKKSKSVKQPKEFKKPKVYKKHQKNVFANGSLNTYDGN